VYVYDKSALKKCVAFLIISVLYMDKPALKNSVTYKCSVYDKPALKKSVTYNRCMYMISLP
jgi:hypothetical protein